MVTTPKKSGARNAKKKPAAARDGDIKSFFFAKTSPKNSGDVEAKAKSTKSTKDVARKRSPVQNKVVARKRSPAPNRSAESNTKRRRVSGSERERNMRQRSLNAVGFTSSKISKSPPRISVAVTNAVKERIEQNIDDYLLERDAVTVPVEVVRQNQDQLHPPGALIPVSTVPLNPEQQHVVASSPWIPLSVSAGAGTGKTRTMVQRTISFINDHRINPKNILIVTFSRLATEEVVERVTKAFGKETDLPTIKTFHALAYSWVCRYWKICGLSRRPNILSPNSGESSLMKQVFERIVDSKRLERCLQKLQMKAGDEKVCSWDDVILAFRSEYKDVHKELKDTAKSEAEVLFKKQLKKKDITPEENDAINDDMKAKSKFLLKKKCYLYLVNKKECDLERLWIGDKNHCSERCKTFLALVHRARLGGHDYNEYPFEDAQVWQLYDQLQRETGRIDFDTMLLLFAEKVLNCEGLAMKFHGRYTHVIVDEYQDNSQMQALMLSKIVERGCLTVVGDEDQCIYEFRGAAPGNFARLKKEFAEKRKIQVQEAVLFDNYRSSKNILTVASSFLEGDRWRQPKTLRATKAEGNPVEVWECSIESQQAKHIVREIIKRRNDDHVPYGDMAVLFRCLKMRDIGPLSTDLQKELVQNKIPFNLVGNTSILERASVRDLLAYVQLSIRGSPNDDAFERCINTPRRRLRKNTVIPLIKEFLDENTMRNGGEGIHITCLQDAAKMMVEKNVGLTASQHTALAKFLADIKMFQTELNNMPLPQFLKHLWVTSGLCGFYERNKKGKGKKNNKNADDEDSDDKDEKGDGDEDEYKDDEDEKGDGDEDEEEENECNGDDSNTSKASQGPYYPEEIRVLFDLSKQHIDEWKKREQMIRSQNKIPSLLDLSREVVLENRNAYDFESLPDHVVDEMILAPAGLGRSVVDNFLAAIMLQHSSIEDQPHDDSSHDDKVTISSVHRAKGLEWNDVYVPYLNDGFLPTSYREEGPRQKRHLSGCDALNGGRCDKSCKSYFATQAAKERGDPEERHMNEERRLAHVAASRAKEKLVLLSVDAVYSRRDKEFTAVKPSPFLERIKNQVTIVNRRKR